MSGFYLANCIAAPSKVGCLCTAHGVCTGAESLSEAAAVERAWGMSLLSSKRGHVLY